MKFHIRLILLHLLHLANELVGLAGPMCDITLYPIPYVRVLRKRNGPHIASLERSGFMDLTKYIHKILCMNGPVVIYTEVAHIGEDNDTTLYSNATLKVHIHECLIINQITTSKAIKLRDDGVSDPSLFDVEPQDIVGLKTTAVYLVSEPNDYYLTTSVMFRQRKWNYLLSPNDSITDGSFVTIGKGPFCLGMGNALDIVLKGDGLLDTSLCKWTLDEKSVSPRFLKRYLKIFNGTITRRNLTWHACGPNSGEGGDGIGPYPIDDEPTTTTPSTISYDPFAIIDPKFWSMKLKKKIKKHDYQRGNETNWRNDTGVDPNPDPDDPVDDNEDFVIIINPKMCTQLVAKPTTPPPDCNTEAPEPCKILEKIVEIEPDPPATPTDPPAPSETSLEGELEWKKDILDLTSEIFGKICEPFPTDMPFTIGRIMEYYLAKAHFRVPTLPKEKKDVWHFLTSELNRCNNGIKRPMLWYWDNLDELEMPDPIPVVECFVNTCSNKVCEVDETRKTCKMLEDIDCSTGTPNCATGCIYESDGQICTGANCNPDPICSIEGCEYNATTATCYSPECLVAECDPAQHCKPSFNMEMCEQKQLPPGGSGAYPSTIPAVNAAAPGSPGAPAAPTTPSGLTSPFHLAYTQEILLRKTSRSYNFNGYPVNVLVITNIYRRMVQKALELSGPIEEVIDNSTNITGECLFFYEDMAEADYELNIAIDIFWKIWATVIGYCNIFYQVRKSETFPRLYNTFYEDFLEPIVEDWKYPKENEVLRIIMSAYNSEKAQRWLDVCLESSYMVSNSSTYRPPRPLTIGNPDSPQANYFLQIPEYIYSKYHNVDLSKLNETLKCP